MFKYSVFLITATLLLSSPVLAQDETAPVQTEASKIVPLIKMTKPKLKIVFTKQPMDTFEDEVIAHGAKMKYDIKANDPVICKKLGALGSRLDKGQEHCAHKSQWDIKKRNVQKQIKDFTQM